MRWSLKINQNVDTPNVDKFLDEVSYLCIEHGYTIGHEDCQGAFIVSKYTYPNDLDWLKDAMIDSTVDKL